MNTGHSAVLHQATSGQMDVSRSGRGRCCLHLDVCATLFCHRIVLQGYCSEYCTVLSRIMLHMPFDVSMHPEEHSTESPALTVFFNVLHHSCIVTHNLHRSGKNSLSCDITDLISLELEKMHT